MVNSMDLAAENYDHFTA